MSPSVRIFRDIQSLSRNAADLFLEITTQAIQEHGRALIAISGGSTPLRLYHLLAIDPHKSQIQWQSIYIFWADERCVPIEDSENNYSQARTAFLDHVNIPEQNIFRFKSDIEPAVAAHEYALTLRGFAEPPYDWPRFDLVLLGMGEDGHTASLFPGSPIDVDSPTLSVTANYQGRPANRLTLTPVVFNSARQIVFLVSGENKAGILARVLDDENYQPALYPAQRINLPGGEVTWLIDEAAAGNLPREMKLKFCEG